MIAVQIVNERRKRFLKVSESIFHEQCYVKGRKYLKLVVLLSKKQEAENALHWEYMP